MTSHGPPHHHPHPHPPEASPAPTVARFPPWRWLWHGRVNAAEAEKGFALQHQRDPRGLRWHLCLAALFCFLLPFPTTWTEWAGLPVAVIWVLRLWSSYRTLWHLLWQPQMVLLVAFVAWEFVTLRWTPDADLGLKQISQARWVWVMWVIWPVIERRMPMIYALCAGFLCANLAQLLHALGRAWDIPALVWPRMDDRNAAWWDPVVGGTMLTAALGLHLPAAALAHGRQRLIGLAGSAATLAGILATGSRGAWLASAGLLIVAAVAGARRAKRRGFAAAVVVVLLALAIALPLVEGPVKRRIDRATSEIAGALRDRDYTTDTGARIIMARWAIEALAENPIGGVGVGGYPGWVRQHLAARGEDPARFNIYAHAHNTFLHVAATTGLVGLLMAIALAASALAAAARAARQDPGNAYALGPLFAMLGLLLVSPFDTIHVNAQTAALLAVLLALCPAWLPGTAPQGPPATTPQGAGTPS